MLASRQARLCPGTDCTRRSTAMLASAVPLPELSQTVAVDCLSGRVQLGRSRRVSAPIPKHGVTHMCGAPIVYNTLINAPDAPKGAKARPVVGLIAGAAPPVAVLEGAESIGIKLTHVYGLTEVYGPASVCAEQPGWDDLPADQRAQLKRRQGVPYPLEEAVTVLDPETMLEVPRD